MPKGEGLADLGQSALLRLAAALEGVDDMYRAWQLPTDNGHTIQLSIGIEPQPVASILSVTDASECA